MLVIDIFLLDPLLAKGRRKYNPLPSSNRKQSGLFLNFKKMDRKQSSFGWKMLFKDCGLLISCFLNLLRTQAGRGHGVVARGRAGGPPPRGPVRAVRPAATGARGVARAPVQRGPLRAKGSLPGKVNFCKRYFYYS